MLTMRNYAARFPFVMSSEVETYLIAPLRIVRDFSTSLEMTEGLVLRQNRSLLNLVRRVVQIPREKHSLGQRRAGHSCRCRAFCYRRFPTIRSTSKTRSPPASGRKISRPARISPTRRRRRAGCADHSRTRREQSVWSEPASLGADTPPHFETQAFCSITRRRRERPVGT